MTKKQAKAVPQKPVEAVPANRDKTGRFVAGRSGNPNGRPKKLPITDAIREELEKRGKSNVRNDIAIARQLVKMAVAGDLDAIREIADRAEGKSRQRSEISGPEGGPIPFELPGTREELERRLAELLKQGNGG